MRKALMILGAFAATAAAVTMSHAANGYGYVCSWSGQYGDLVCVTKRTMTDW